jgi:coatomer subunit beta'
VWNSGTYRVENTLSYSLERAWCVALQRDANEVAVGFDEGVVVIKVYILILHPIPSLIDGT